MSSAASIWEISIKASLGKLSADPREVLAAALGSGMCHCLLLSANLLPSATRLPGSPRGSCPRVPASTPGSIVLLVRPRRKGRTHDRLLTMRVTVLAVLAAEVRRSAWS